MPTTYGQPANALTSTAQRRWAANATAVAAGADGERRTAELLVTLPHHAVVLHDVMVPIPGWEINVDHIVVVGSDVTLIDSKCWKPGCYVTVAGRTWRGMQRFPPGDGATLMVAARRFKTMLPTANVQRSIVVVHPSSPGRVALGLYRPHDAVAATARGFERLIGRWSRGPDQRVDRAAVEALARLVRRRQR